MATVTLINVMQAPSYKHFGVNDLTLTHLPSLKGGSAMHRISKLVHVTNLSCIVEQQR